MLLDVGLRVQHSRRTQHHLQLSVSLSALRNHTVESYLLVEEGDGALTTCIVPLLNVVKDARQSAWMPRSAFCCRADIQPTHATFQIDLERGTQCGMHALEFKPILCGSS
jgi:hypothetical protein